MMPSFVHQTKHNYATVQPATTSFAITCCATCHVPKFCPRCGIRLQHAVNLYNENGVAVDYSSKHLKPGKLYVGFSYVTSRLGTALGSNAIKQDNLLLSAAWYFRPQHIIRPFGRLNLGYFSADYGNKMFDVLPSKSALLSTDIGVCFETNCPIKIAASIGYNFITGNGLTGPGTLYPLFYQLTLSWNVFDHGQHKGNNKKR